MKGAKMPSIVGQIEELDKEGRATSGRNKKYSVKINDGGSLGSRYFGAFQKELVSSLEEGDYVNVMYSETPNKNNPDYPYLNIDAMTKVTEDAYNESPSSPVITEADKAKAVQTHGTSNGAGPSKAQAHKMPDSPAVQLSFQCQHATEAALQYAQMVGDKTLPEVMDYVDYIVHRWNSTILSLKDNLENEDYLQESILTSDVGVEN
jgi:predicted DNA-binding ArsR family transcriptional regulator